MENQLLEQLSGSWKRWSFAISCCASVLFPHPLGPVMSSTGTTSTSSPMGWSEMKKSPGNQGIHVIKGKTCSEPIFYICVQIIQLLSVCVPSCNSSNIIQPSKTCNTCHTSKLKSDQSRIFNKSAEITSCNHVQSSSNQVSMVKT